MRPSVPEVKPAGPVRYSVVVPVYGNAETLGAVIDRLVAISEELGGPMEAVFVVDGSPDHSLQLLHTLLRDGRLPAQVLAHSRNFGSFAAIRTGLAAARGSYIGVMAADLQEPAELMRDFFALMEADEADVVVGRRNRRADPAMTSIMSRTFWSAYRKVVNPEIPRGGVDVFGCSSSVARQLVALEESNSSLVGLLFWVGYRRAEVPYDRQERMHGKSGWSFRKKVDYLLDSTFAFTSVPIHVLVLIGALGTALTLVLAVLVLGFWLAGRIREPGYTPLMLLMSLSTFSTMLGLGIVGSYVWRTYENSKARPSAITMAAWEFPSADDHPKEQGE